MLSAKLWVDYPQKVDVLRGAAIDIFPGEILGLVGRSGSGKTTLALALLRLLDHTGARVHGATTLLGRDLTGLSERRLREIRGRQVSLIPQSPTAALNPALRIETQLREAWYAHSREPWSGQRRRVAALLASVGLPPDEEVLQRFPSEISVGQAQRILIAMALLHGPPLLIADEPTSALDVIVGQEILRLLAGIVREHRASLLLISHDLPTVAILCQRVAILYDGEIVECGATRDVLHTPVHSYTRQLVAAIPKWE